MEMGPQLKVSSDRLEKMGSNSLSLVYEASGLHNKIFHLNHAFFNCRLVLHTLLIFRTSLCYKEA